MNDQTFTVDVISDIRETYLVYVVDHASYSRALSFGSSEIFLDMLSRMLLDGPIIGLC